MPVPESAGARHVSDDAGCAPRSVLNFQPIFLTPDLIQRLQVPPPKQEVNYCPLPVPSTKDPYCPVPEGSTSDLPTCTDSTLTSITEPDDVTDVSDDSDEATRPPRRATPGQQPEPPAPPSPSSGPRPSRTTARYPFAEFSHHPQPLPSDVAETDDPPRERATIRLPPQPATIPNFMYTPELDLEPDGKMPAENFDYVSTIDEVDPVQEVLANHSLPSARNSTEHDSTSIPDRFHTLHEYCRRQEDTEVANISPHDMVLVVVCDPDDNATQPECEAAANLALFLLSESYCKHLKTPHYCLIRRAIFEPPSYAFDYFVTKMSIGPFYMPKGEVQIHTLRGAMIDLLEHLEVTSYPAVILRMGERAVLLDWKTKRPEDFNQAFLVGVKKKLAADTQPNQ